MTNLENLRSKSIDEVAQIIDASGYLELQDKICLEMCPEQDLRPRERGVCGVHKKVARKRMQIKKEQSQGLYPKENITNVG